MSKRTSRAIAFFICLFLISTQFISVFAQSETAVTESEEVSAAAEDETTGADAESEDADAGEADKSSTDDSIASDSEAAGAYAESEPENKAPGERAASNHSENGVSQQEIKKDSASEEEPGTEANEKKTCKAFTARIIDTGSVKVTVDVPEGAFSEKVTAKGRKVSSDKVRDTVEQELGGNAGSISAVDISFYTEDGKELEPVKPVTVRVNAYGLDAESYKVVHIKDNGNAEVVASSEDSSFSFKTDSFSIYTIVGDEDGTVRRTYNFYNGDKLVDSQIVKNGDKLVEPSVPSSGKEGEMFLGWSADDGKTFQKFDKTIDDIDETADKDETVNLYACYDTALSVIFYDKHGTVIETVYSKTGDEVSVDDVEFEVMAGEYVSGWTTSSDGTPEGAVTGSVTLKDKNIKLYPIVKNVHWLIFHDKGSDSDPSIPTHTEAYYLTENQVTTRPEDPTRPGYDFGKWTTDPEGSNAFTFGNKLTKDTVLYAQWEAEEAEYQVLVWSEALVNEKYVEGNYALSNHYTLKAPSGSEVSLSEDDPLVQELIGKTAYQYHELKKIDGPAIVKGDGTTTLNIYLDLKVYKIEFQAMPKDYYHKGILRARGGVLAWQDPVRNYTWWLGDVYESIAIRFMEEGREYSNYEKYIVEAHYGENIASVWPDSATAYWKIIDGSLISEDIKNQLEDLKPSMHPTMWQTNDRNQLTHSVMGYASNMTNLTKALINDNSTDTMHLYIAFGINLKRINGNYWLENVENNEFTISELYSFNKYVLSGLSAKDLTGFTLMGTPKAPIAPEGYPSGYSTDEEQVFHFYYRRNHYPLHFYNYNKVEKEYTGDDAIKYEAPLESYDYTPERPAELPDEYAFGGWYTTEECFDGTEFSFDGAIMPIDGLTLYAKWEAPKYTVSFNSNGGSEVQAQTVDYGKQAQVPEEPVREGYTFGGWMKGSSPFNFNTEIYADTKLTAKWLSDETIEIVYDEGKHGSNPPSDDNKYTDVSKTRIQSSPDVNNGYRFVGWKCGDELYYPGSLFTVLSSDAEKVSDSLYRITMKAVYKKDVPEVRVIYYRNHPGLTDGDEAYALTEYMPNNDTVVLDDPGELDFKKGGTAPGGWRFLYWADNPDGSGRHFNPGDTVAADFNGDNVLYAVWEAEECIITYDPNGGIFRGSKKPTEITYLGGEVISIAEAPEREGYTFLYWQGSEYQPDDKYTVEGDHTFTAMWKKNGTPDDSIEPDNPSDPDNPSRPSTPGTGGHTPKTGDYTDITGLLSIMLMCIIMLVSVTLLRKKTEGDRSS